MLHIEPVYGHTSLLLSEQIKDSPELVWLFYFNLRGMGSMRGGVAE